MIFGEMVFQAKLEELKQVPNAVPDGACRGCRYAIYDWRFPICFTHRSVCPECMERAKQAGLDKLAATLAIKSEELISRQKTGIEFLTEIEEQRIIEWRPRL